MTVSLKAEADDSDAGGNGELAQDWCLEDVAGASKGLIQPVTLSAYGAGFANFNEY